MPLLTVASWWPLALAAVLPLVWWMPGRTLTSFGPRQLRLQAAVRTATLGLVALALMQPVWRHAAGRLSVVYAVDVSQSIAPAWIADAARWIDQARASGRADTEILAFASRSASVHATGELAAATREVGPEATDLAGAISAALDRLPADSIRRLVLLTDGRATTGDLADAIARAQREQVRIDTVPAAVRSTHDVWVEQVDAPDEVTAGEPFALTVAVGSQDDRPGAVEIRQGARVLARETVRLQPGTTRVVLQPKVASAGAQILEVAVRAGTDGSSASDSRDVAVSARPRPRVLYVESRPESARYLRRALEDGGFTVDVLSPDRLPASAEALNAYAGVILSDVARTDMTDARMAAVDRYVADLGGGLVMAGGEAMYGVEGYAKTQLERTLPVTFKMKDKPDEFAMVIILDKSWSMAGQKIELAKEAAVAAVEVLPDRHRIGLIAFNDGMEWIVPLQLAANRQRIIAAIRAIVPSGHTNLFPAVEDAFRELARTKADLKHVLVLSDGRTYPDEYEALARKMLDAKITMSSVALGDDADRELLANLATWGHGRTYVVQNAVEVPQVFVKETQRAARSTFVERSVRPVVRKPVELLAGLELASAPPLLGYARVQAKDTAEVILAAGEENDPILVRWPYGLGRAAVFTSDVKDRWAHDWLNWRGYGKFWTQVVRATIRRDEVAGTEPVASLRVARDAGRARVVVTMSRPDGAYENLEALRVAAQDGQGRVVDAALSQTAPGTYEGDVPIGAGAATLRLLGGADGRRVLAERRVVARPSLERQPMPPDTVLLEALARDTGGRYNPRPAQVVDDRGDRVMVGTPLWPYLAVLAAALWLVDLGLRRVRVLERDGAR